MTDLPGGDAAARAIHRAHAKLVRFTGAGVTYKSLHAVRGHAPAGFLMNDQTARQLTFEIRKEDLRGNPGEGDTLIENDGAGPIWEVIEWADLDDVDAVRVVVAKAS
jgi:hypothetical protein